jgi:hypothetical protein
MKIHLLQMVIPLNETDDDKVQNFELIRVMEITLYFSG